MIIFTMTSEYDEIDRQVFVDEPDAVASLRREYGDVLQEDSEDLDEILSDLILAYPDILFDIYDTGDPEDSLDEVLI